MLKVSIKINTFLTHSKFAKVTKLLSYIQKTISTIIIKKIIIIKKSLL